ncbi:MAG: hypothetical protein HPY44_19560 [Armatimonadetes bacterium]|nr:hypothetical protein [Armatimonadota bacterium]
MTRREFGLAVGVLLGLAALMHFVHYLIFRDAHHIFIYLLGDIAFLPVDILVLVLIVERVLADRERRARAHKLNMVIGAFFSELGRPLLQGLDRCSVPDESLRGLLGVDMHWTERQLRDAITRVRAIEVAMRPAPSELSQLRDLLKTNRAFLLSLLENPNLMEHETFTDCLWEVFHLCEELEARTDLTALPATDMHHLAADARRAYQALLVQWLQYMLHLKHDYPYLFSFAARTNPFRPDASVEVLH